MADLVGQHFGNYRLQRLLGEGGFAQVYLGEHIHLGSLAAIKVLHNRLDLDDQEQFRREARTIVRLKHPNIVRLLEFGIEGSTPFLVMDYAPGGTLRSRQSKSQPLPLATILPYVQQVADALQYAHDLKLIHRDIKPENMLLGEQGEVLLSDFGIAIVAQSSSSQSPQKVAGTAAYMAPEQFQGKPRAASDQYALSIVVYEWLTGTHPFHGSFLEIAGQHIHQPPPPLHEQVPDISPAIEQVVLTALEKDPSARFASVHAFATAFADACQKSQIRNTSPMPVTSVLTNSEPPWNSMGETRLLEATTQIRAHPPMEEKGFEKAVSQPGQEAVRSDTQLAPTIPATAPAAPVISLPHIPTRPRWRHPRQLVSLGVSASLIVLLVALLLIAQLRPPGRLVNTAATSTALEATSNTMQTSTVLASAATATTQSQNATATTPVYAPYTASVPGPCSDKGTGQWQASHPEGVQCLTDRLRLIGEPDTTCCERAGRYNVITFQGPYPGYTFPPDVMVSFEVSGISGSYGVQVAINSDDSVYNFIFFPNSQWFIAIYDATSKTDVYNVQGTFDPGVTNNITMTIRGTTASFELNGQQVGTHQGSGPGAILSINVLVGGNIADRVQADFQNFVFTPLH